MSIVKNVPNHALPARPRRCSTTKLPGGLTRSELRFLRFISGYKRINKVVTWFKAAQKLPPSKLHPAVLAVALANFRRDEQQKALSKTVTVTNEMVVIDDPVTDQEPNREEVKRFADETAKRLNQEFLRGGGVKVWRGGAFDPSRRKITVPKTGENGE